MRFYPSGKDSRISNVLWVGSLSQDETLWNFVKPWGTFLNPWPGMAMTLIALQKLEILLHTLQPLAPHLNVLSSTSCLRMVCQLSFFSTAPSCGPFVVSTILFLRLMTNSRVPCFDAAYLDFLFFSSWCVHQNTIPSWLGACNLSYVHLDVKTSISYSAGPSTACHCVTLWYALHLSKREKKAKKD